MLNGGLWRVCFSNVRKLLILERETGFEPATSSLGSWHSTTELLPPFGASLYLAHSKRDPASPSRLSDLYCLPFSACSDDKTDNKTDNTDWVRMCFPMSPFCGCLIISNFILAQKV